MCHRLHACEETCWISTEQNNERYSTELTERLAQEPFCVACGKDVAGWKVSFENSIHVDSGYARRYRCPHCGELCFEDQNENFGCLIFFLVFYPASVPWFWLVAALFGPSQADEAGDFHGGDGVQAACGIALAFATAYVLSNMCVRLMRRLKRRRISVDTGIGGLDDEHTQPPLSGHEP
jgi:hypothetical protein